MAGLGDAVTKYTKRLDAIVERESLTSVLNMNQDLLGEYMGGGIIKIPDIDMDGLGDYSRANGFPAGSVDLNWTPYQMAYDRGREFTVDVLDDEERELIVSANLMGEFARTKVIPEVDAIRFARLAQGAGTTKTKTFSGDTAVADAVAAVEEAEDHFENLGVELSQCYLFATPAFKRLLQKNGEYRLTAGENPNSRIKTFDELNVIPVPQQRFYTKLDLLDGTTEGEEDGGFAKAADGADLNFLIVHPSAAAALQRHEKLRYFSPEVNQSAEAHLWQYRLYHDLLVFSKKSGLIWASKKA